MKVDTKINCNVRVSLCVTEQRNDLNVPLMFFTPNKDDYVVNIGLAPGMDQQIEFSELTFDLRVIKQNVLKESTHEYFPLVVSINYNKDSKNIAFIGYYVFTGENRKDSLKEVRLIKQSLIIDGLPFEIKSIYGLEMKTNDADDKAQPIKGQAEEDSSKECTICMSVDSNTIIMPCGHLCCCIDCGKSLQKSAHNICPVCRGPIQTLVPLKI